MALQCYEKIKRRSNRRAGKTNIGASLFVYHRLVILTYGHCEMEHADSSPSSPYHGLRPAEVLRLPSIKNQMRDPSYSPGSGCPMMSVGCQRVCSLKGPLVPSPTSPPAP